MRFPVAILLLASLTLIPGCAKLRQLDRFFLTGCPEDGPNPERELDLFLRPIELDGYLENLRAAADGFSLETIAEVPFGERSWPIQHARRRRGSAEGKRLLVVAGVHGNEIGGALAAPEILLDVREHPEVYEGLDLHLVAPANPVGLAHGARYNAQGCDLNRDFSAFETPEARAIRDVIDETAPDLILSLHEGPHDGFFVIATRSTPSSLATAIASALEAGGVQLATHSNLGSRLSVPGVMQEGHLLTAAKWLLRIRSLGAWAHGRSTPLLTTEGPWSEPDVDSRVRAQVLSVRAAASALAAGDPLRVANGSNVPAAPIASMCPPFLGESSPAEGDCDCTIEIDREALRRGWVEVRFRWGPARAGRRQLGCSAQGMGGGTIELLRGGTVVHALETAPISSVAPPFFSHGFALQPGHRDAGGAFSVRASHGSWRSNEVGFVLGSE